MCKPITDTSINIGMRAIAAIPQTKENVSELNKILDEIRSRPGWTPNGSLLTDAAIEFHERQLRKCLT